MSEQIERGCHDGNPFPARSRSQRLWGWCALVLVLAHLGAVALARRLREHGVWIVVGILLALSGVALRALALR